jgi:hypothetical protein
MAHSNLKLKTSLTGSRPHLDVCSSMEHAQSSYAQITVPNVTHIQSSWSQNFMLKFYMNSQSLPTNCLYYTKIRSQVYHLGWIAYILDMIQSISLGMYCLHTWHDPKYITSDVLP